MIRPIRPDRLIRPIRLARPDRFEPCGDRCTLVVLDRAVVEIGGGAGVPDAPGTRFGVGVSGVGVSGVGVSGVGVSGVGVGVGVGFGIGIGIGIEIGVRIGIGIRVDIGIDAGVDIGSGVGGGIDIGADVAAGIDLHESDLPGDDPRMAGPALMPVPYRDLDMEQRPDRLALVALVHQHRAFRKHAAVAFEDEIDGRVEQRVAGREADRRRRASAGAGVGAGVGV